MKMFQASQKQLFQVTKKERHISDKSEDRAPVELQAMYQGVLQDLREWINGDY